jgi:hypothetical protein
MTFDEEMRAVSAEALAISKATEPMTQSELMARSIEIYGELAPNAVARLADGLRRDWDLWARKQAGEHLRLLKLLALCLCLLGALQGRGST